MAFDFTSTETYGILAAVLAAWKVLSKVMDMFFEYLEVRFGGKTTTHQVIADQSAQCRFDHERIAELTRSQNEHIAQLLHQNGEQIKALRDSNHNAELRHQVVVNHLDRILEHVRR